MEKEEHNITMVMFIKVNFQRVKDVGMVFICSTKYINTSASGNIIVFGEKESFSRMKKYFFRGTLKKGWSMDKENINMKMVTILKEITLKIAKEAKESIILVKAVSLNHNLILHPLKYLKYT